MDRRKCPRELALAEERTGEGFDFFGEVCISGFDIGVTALTLEFGCKVTPPAWTVAPPACTVTPAGFGVTVAPEVLECVAVGVPVDSSADDAGRFEFATIQPIRNARASAAAATVVCAQT